MIATQQVLDTLKQIGLNLYERKIWVALLSRGTATAGELSSLAKVPHSRTYDILESLAEKGFVVIQSSKPLKYMAMAPSEAFERAKKKIAENSKIAVERLSNMASSPILKELEKIYKHGVELVEPSELTGSLKGRHAMQSQLETLFKGAKSKISILTSADGFKEIASMHADVLKKVAARGIKIRIAAPVGKDAIAGVKDFAEIRKISEKDIAGRFCLIDDTHVVFALTDDKNVHPTQDFALWTQSQHVAGDMLGPMFEALWKGLPSA